MDHAVLVSDFIANGRKLIDALDRDGFDVNTALWLYDGDRERWNLVLASREFASGDTHRAYKRVLRVLRETPDIALESDDLVLASPKDELIRLIRSRYHIEPGEPERRLGGTFVKGVPIDDAILYRVQ